MRFVNGFIKGISIFFIHLIVVIQCYILSLVVTGSVLSILQSFCSTVGFELFSKPFWIAHLISSIPLGIVFIIIIELDLINKFDYWSIKRMQKKLEEEK